MGKEATGHFKLRLGTPTCPRPRVKAIRELREYLYCLQADGTIKGWRPGSPAFNVDDCSDAYIIFPEGNSAMLAKLYWSP